MVSQSYNPSYVRRISRRIAIQASPCKKWVTHSEKKLKKKGIKDKIILKKFI
jgi:hypothetical protein